MGAVGDGGKHLRDVWRWGQMFASIVGDGASAVWTVGNGGSTWGQLWMVIYVRFSVAV